jgi:AraC-like DNA-binding protein
VLRRYPLGIEHFPQLRLMEVGHVPVKTRAYLDPVRGMRHPCYCLHVFVAGTGTWRSEGDAGRLGAGSLLILRPGEWYWFGPDGGTPLNEYWVLFDGDMVRDLVSRLHPCGIHRGLPDTESLPGRFEELIALAASLRAGSQWRAATRFIPLLTDLLLAGGPFDRTSEGEADAVERYAALVHQHIEASESPLAGFLRRECIEIATFRRRFKARIGISPDRYWQAARLVRAKQLLHDSDLSIGGVARVLGMHAVWFNQWFRRATGASPSSFRGSR